MSHSPLRRALAAVVLGGVALAGNLAPQAEARPYCEPHDSRKVVSYQGWKWYEYDSGSVVNKSKKATIHKTIHHSSTESRTTNKTGEVGASIKFWVVEINAKYSYGVSKTAAYTKGSAFTVDVPPQTKVKYKDGIIVRTFKVKRVHTYDNCNTKTFYGYVRASDYRSVVWDA